MAYIGNRPEQGNFRKCDAITTSATATYNLLVGGVAVNPNQNQCIVSLNGVIQSSGNSYSIASSQITFSQALTSNDVIDFILILGDTLDVGVPSDDSVGLAQFSATGSPSSSNFLRGDNSWQTVSAGTSLSGSTNNTVTTVTGANAIQGEANLTFDGNEMTVQGTPVVVGTNSSSVLDLKNTNSSADGRAVGIAFSTNTGGSANAHITAVQDANAKGTLNFGGYDGTSTRNIVMSVNAGTGAVTKPLQPCAMWASGNNYNITGDGTSITMGQTAGASLSEIYDLGSNLVDGVFTAPVTGKYQMSFNWSLDNLSSNNNSLIIMKTSNREYYTFSNFYPLRRGSGNSVAGGWSMTVDMDANDVAEWKIQVSDMSKIVDITDLTIGAIHLVA